MVELGACEAPSSIPDIAQLPSVSGITQVTLSMSKQYGPKDGAVRLALLGCDLCKERYLKEGRPGLCLRGEAHAWGPGFNFHPPTIYVCTYMV